MRTSRLQEEGRFLEMMQLAEWITALEPQYAEVWAFHAWNLAYNVSVLFPDPADRWRWVQNGMALLRDRALRLNPDSARLHWEIGWLFLNKIGASADAAEMYYKIELAAGMEALLGGGEFDPARLAADPARLEALRAHYGLRVEAMQAVDHAYGPLDWRNPESHAVYWARRGLDVAGPERDMRCDRMLAQGLTMLVRRGRLVFDPERRVYLRTVNLERLPAAEGAWEQAVAFYRDDDSFRDGYASLLQEAVLCLYAFGHEPEAAARLTRLAGLAPARARTGSVREFVEDTLDQSLRGDTPAQTVRLLERLCYQAAQWRQYGDEATAEGLDAFARLHWEAGRRRHGTASLPEFEAMGSGARTQVLAEAAATPEPAR
jgi:hypothetical protein